MDPRLQMIDLSGPELTADERAYLREGRVAGVCLFGRNAVDPAQVGELVQEVRRLAGRPLLVATDQEGGGVVRIHDVPYPPAAMALGAAGDPELTRAVAAATARGLRGLGVNVDFAPVADVNVRPENPVIADRSFGSEPEAVGAQVAAFVRGLQAEGVAATLKHFPGHGATDVDSHLALPRLQLDADTLWARELVPFRAGLAAGAAAVMSAHIVLPALDADAPATLSRTVLGGLLRVRLGFDGVVFTDALDMRAVQDRFGLEEASVRAVEAGADVPVGVGDVRRHARAADALVRAVAEGRLDPAAVATSRARISRLARDFPGRAPEPGAVWRDGDEALLDEAARRGLAALGTLPRLGRGMRVALVAAGEVHAGEEDQLTARPADLLGKELAARGALVERLGYDLAGAGLQSEALAARACEAEAVLFASTARTVIGEAEAALARAVADAARSAGKVYAHVAMWNPYSAARLPGPALLTFGFRERSVRAAAEALLGAPVTGRLPAGL